MRRRKLVCASIAALLTLSIIALIPSVSGIIDLQPKPAMWVSPAEYNATVLGETFVIDVMVDDIPEPGTETTYNGTTYKGVSGITFRLDYDKDYLDVVSISADPDGWAAGFATSLLPTYEGDQNAAGEAGWTGAGWGILVAIDPNEYAWTMTPEKVATITFNVTQDAIYPAVLTCALDMHTVLMTDAATVDVIIHDETDGEYNFVTEAPLPPIAAFTWSPLSPEEGETVNFDASATDPQGGYILWYEWDFYNNDTYVQNVTTKTTTFTYPVAGTYDVNLTVKDSELETDSLTKSITVRKPAVGPVVDIFTNQEALGAGMGGKGPASELIGPPSAAGHSSSYDPGDEVVLTAEVKYNADPVGGIRVSFFVGTTDNATTYLTALATGFEQGIEYFIVRSNVTTYPDGTCTIKWRIPIPYGIPELAFGHYVAVAGCEVVGKEVIDILTFNVGWLTDFTAETKGFVPGPDIWLPRTTFYKTEYVGLDIIAKNIAFIPLNVTYEGLMLDEGGQTIGGFEYNAIVPGAPYHPIFGFAYLPEYDMFVVDGEIPFWAYIGDAVFYVNAFTLEWEAFCREKAVLFIIARP